MNFYDFPQVQARCLWHVYASWRYHTAQPKVTKETQSVRILHVNPNKAFDNTNTTYSNKNHIPNTGK